MPELGPQVARTGAIGSRGKAAIRALRSVLARASAHHYDHLIAGATEAIRVARDGEEFARQAGDAIGTPVHVISAHREAELSFLGVASRHAARREWVMVDLGGASSEVAIGRAREMVRWASLPIGSGVLASTYLSDPPKPEERARMRRAALRELAHAPDADVERLVATGGTASNLPQVLAKRNPPAVLTTADLLTCESRLDGGRAVDVAGGLAAHSLALLSDAGHVLTDVFALGLAWFAVAQARRPADQRRSYGYHRVSILAALVNAVTLIVIVIAITYEAVRRLASPEPVQAGIVIAAALAGVAINSFIAIALRSEPHDLNLRAALVHVVGDVAVSAGVVVAGVIILLTGFLAVDPALSIVIGAVIAYSAWKLVRDTVNLLLEGTPREIDLAAVTSEINDTTLVSSMHDLN